MPEKGTCLTAAGLTLRGAGGRPAVRDLDLTAGPGTLTAVAGPGRSGRTSLVLALAGRMRPAGGTVRLGPPGSPGGASSAAPTSRAELRERVAVARALDEFEPDPYATVGELCRSAHRFARRRASAADLDAALGAVGLPRGSDAALDPRTRYGRLHPHDRLLLAVALALAGRPDAVVVDGVDRGLDDASRTRAWAALRAAAERGTTIVATCDSAAAARAEARRVLELAHPADKGDA